MAHSIGSKRILGGVQYKSKNYFLYAITDTASPTRTHPI